MILIISLIAIAFVMIFFEVILPGGILGVLAAICIIAATVFAIQDFGLLAGALIFFAAVIGIFVFVLVELKLLANTKYGGKLFLRASIDGHSNPVTSDETLIGQRGETLTRLNPTGMISINGKKYEAFSQDGYIERGQPVTVLNRDNFRLIIQKTT
ncbi:MAG: NfeD family protein [Verrucomicrobiota bacterium]